MLHFIENNAADSAKSQLAELYQLAPYFGDPRGYARRVGYTGTQRDFDKEYAEKKKTKEREELLAAQAREREERERKKAEERKKRQAARRRVFKVASTVALGMVAVALVGALIVTVIAPAIGGAIAQHDHDVRFSGGHHSDDVSTVAWSPNGKYIASGANDDTVQVWNAETRELLYTYKGHHDDIRAIAWSPDGTRIVSVSHDATPENRIHVWDALTGGHDLTYHGFDYLGAIPNGVYPYYHTSVTAAWSPDGTLIAVGADTFVQVWRAATGKLIYTFTGHHDLIEGLAWSPDSTRIASASYDATADFKVHVWDATTGAHDFTYKGISDVASRVMSLAWSPDGALIATGSTDTSVQVWKAATGELVYTYRGHHDEVDGLAWSPDSTRIASISHDATPGYKVHVWDATTGAHDYTYAGYLDATVYVTCVAWAPDGTRIATGSTDDTVQVWQPG